METTRQHVSIYRAEESASQFHPKIDVVTCDGREQADWQGTVVVFPEWTLSTDLNSTMSVESKIDSVHIVTVWKAQLSCSLSASSANFSHKDVRQRQHVLCRSR
uniref:Uncharacterized protein n=1 Tax=Compsopogon caeruleus TaxID=31354 RepID=A0A7S1T4T1_9RHOD|mmetsp:Transcript_10370/g.20914  ORF Transcript_10370/g.20914 Transcript_10370/m.20914 type:complete len:104 (+) Transcript_10370:139-450(+)